MIHFNKSVLLAMLTVALLTACGQSTTDTASSAPLQTNLAASSTQSSQATASSPLLQSLAAVYPDGQLPAASAAQAAKELAQNPAALKITAQSAPITAQSNAQNTGAPIQAQATSADYKAVTRIQNTTLTGAYFFTIYDTERITALASNPNWKLEGPAFWASLASGTGLKPVHRFRNNFNGSYLYTIYETEKADIQTNYASTFFYEGIAWYAQQTPGTGWSPLYRFRNLLNGTYFFSAFEAEKDAIVADYSAVFKLEGVAYYIRQDANVPCAADATSSTGYSLVFKGCSAANVAEYYDKTECVRDNATGLIWQGQTPAGTGLRANNQYKTNFTSTTELQKQTTVTGAVTSVAPTQAEVDAVTNSVGFTNAVNASNLCGSTAWRLPVKDELLTIFKANQSPSFDSVAFPNTNTAGVYISSTPYLNAEAHIWGFYLSTAFGPSSFAESVGRGNAFGLGKAVVRLVH